MLGYNKIKIHIVLPRSQPNSRSCKVQGNITRAFKGRRIGMHVCTHTNTPTNKNKQTHTHTHLLHQASGALPGALQTHGHLCDAVLIYVAQLEGRGTSSHSLHLMYNIISGLQRDMNLYTGSSSSGRSHNC